MEGSDESPLRPDQYHSNKQRNNNIKTDLIFYSWKKKISSHCIWSNTNSVNLQQSQVWELSHPGLFSLPCGQSFSHICHFYLLQVSTCVSTSACVSPPSDVLNDTVINGRASVLSACPVWWGAATAAVSGDLIIWWTQQQWRGYIHSGTLVLLL